MKVLLDAGANMDVQSANGGTPLMRAIESTQRDIVKLLIDRGYVRKCVRACMCMCTLVLWVHV